MEKWQGRNAFVAGANSGIGAGVTKRFLENGIKVYALDKDIDGLYEMKNGDFGENLTILQADVTKEEDIQRSIKWLDENVDEINIVFYSIGIIGSNSLVDGEYTEWQKMLNVNVVGFCSCMKAIINLMLKQNVQEAYIIAVNCMTALEPVFVNELHFYAALCSGVSALLQGLRHELRERNDKIKLSVLYPGMVRTKVFQNSLGLPFDSPMYKTFVTLTVDDVVESTDYILSTKSDVLVSHIVLTPRGLLKQNYFNGQ